MRKLALLIYLFVLSLPSATISFAQQMKVKIVDRRTSMTNYTYQIPGHSYSSATGNANCSVDTYGGTASADCSGSNDSYAVTTAPRDVSFNVTGATLALKLPDGRIAIVNCVSKFAERFAGPSGNHRSCRIPIANEIEANFKGDRAKLAWVVSLDGKKKKSETYEILGVFPSTQANPTSEAPMPPASIHAPKPQD